MSEVAGLGAIARVHDRLPFARPPGARALMEAARRRTGLSDFGPQPVEDALERLQASYREEAELTLFGRLSVQWDSLRFLTNLLVLRDRERADPSILRRSVERPIFVLGLPRSGSSFLHALLAQDEASRAPRCWQAIYPYPGHPAAGRGAGPDRVQRQFSLYHRLAPRMKELHPFDARSPQECSEISAHSFKSLRFDTTHHVPSYRRWLDQAGYADGYAVHRRFLQHLDGGDGARWVLKSPDHVFSLDALRAAYPDACIVMTHRDPLKVLPSVARLTEEVRRPFTRRRDRRGIGAQIGADWAVGARRLVAADREGLWPAAQVFHVRYKALTAAPVETLEQLYGFFGLELTAGYRRRLLDFVARKPRGGYGRNVYRFEDFGLDPRAERERHLGYTRHFDVEEEVALA